MKTVLTYPVLGQRSPIQEWLRHELGLRSTGGRTCADPLGAPKPIVVDGKALTFGEVAARIPARARKRKAIRGMWS